MPIKSAFVIAALSSGSGKTTVTNGLLRAFTRMGKRCIPYKVGPDYIDPIFHKVSSGHDSINLDLFMMSEEHVKTLFYSRIKDSDVAIIEGVMGIFDGYNLKKGSAAEIAKLLGIPIILVLDAKSSAYSLAAVISGIKNFDKEIDIRGVIFNNVSSEKHKYLLSLAAKDGEVECLGYLRNCPNLFTPSRYLGLDIDNINGIESYVSSSFEAVSIDIDLERLLEITKVEIPYEDRKMLTSTPTSEWNGKRIGIAQDEAFNFIYPENIRAFRNMIGKHGKIIFFSPLRDRALPIADMIYFPGGYPELYATRLSANEQMKLSIKIFSEKGGCIYGECGGLIYLSDEVNGNKMCGIFPFNILMNDKRDNLGYRSVCIGDLSIRGHEFHYSTIKGHNNLPSIAREWNILGEEVETGLFRICNTVAGYTHLYWGENRIAERFFSKIFN